MKEFIIYQLIVISEDANINKGNIDNKIEMDCIIRRVKAKDKESAIGKFIISTQDIIVRNKLEICCIPLNELNTIE